MIAWGHRHCCKGSDRNVRFKRFYFKKGLRRPNRPSLEKEDQ